MTGRARRRLPADVTAALGVLALGAADVENVAKGYAPRVGAERGQAVLDRLLDDGLAWLDGIDLRLTVIGRALALDTGWDPSAPIVTSHDLARVCWALELVEPGSEHSTWRARPDGDRWVVDVGTGDHTATVKGSWPDRETAVLYGPEAVREAREALAADWEETLLARHGGRWRVDEMRACLHAQPTVVVDEPVGATEIAARLGVTRPTVDQWGQRRLLPGPDWTVGGRPAWRWSTIERWARETGRLGS